MKIRTMLLVTSFATAVFAGSPALAVVAIPSTSTLTYQTDVPSFNSSGLQTTPLSLMQFDPVLGTLLGITFRTEVSSFDISVSLSSYDNGSGGNFVSADLQGGQYSVSKRLNGGGGLLFASLVGPQGSISSELDTLDATSATPVLTSEDATTKLQDENAFSDFVGTGTVAGLEWGYFFFGNFGNAVYLDNGLKVEAETSVTQSVGMTTVYVDYVYQTAVVPEPATWGLMLSGLALVGAVARRRRSQ